MDQGDGPAATTGSAPLRFQVTRGKRKWPVDEICKPQRRLSVSIEQRLVVLRDGPNPPLGDASTNAPAQQPAGAPHRSTPAVGVIDLFGRCPDRSDGFEFAGELLDQVLHADGLRGPLRPWPLIG